jgi:hypothetical protein
LKVQIRGSFGALARGEYNERVGRLAGLVPAACPQRPPSGRGQHHKIDDAGVGSSDSKATGSSLLGCAQMPLEKLALFRSAVAASDRPTFVEEALSWLSGASPSAAPSQAYAEW